MWDKKYLDMLGLKLPLYGIKDGYRFLTFEELHYLWGTNQQRKDVETWNYFKKCWESHYGNSTHDIHRTKNPLNFNWAIYE